MKNYDRIPRMFDRIPLNADGNMTAFLEERSGDVWLADDESKQAIPLTPGEATALFDFLLLRIEYLRAAERERNRQ